MTDPIYKLIYRHSEVNTVKLKKFTLNFTKPIKYEIGAILNIDIEPYRELKKNPLIISPFDTVDSLIMANIDAHLGFITTINPLVVDLDKKAKITYQGLSTKSLLNQYLRIRFKEIVFFDEKGEKPVDFVYNPNPGANDIYKALELCIKNSDKLVTAVAVPNNAVQRNAIFTIAQCFEEITLFRPITIKQDLNVYFLVASRLRTRERGYEDFLGDFVDIGSVNYQEEDIPNDFTKYLNQILNSQVDSAEENLVTDYDYWKIHSLLVIPSYPIKQEPPKLVEGCFRYEQTRGDFRGRGRGDYRGERGRSRGERGYHRGGGQRGRGERGYHQGGGQRGRGERGYHQGGGQRGRGDYIATKIRE